MTRSHNDRINEDSMNGGYSIRVGKKLPVNSANLAYVYTPKAAPEKNLVINDLSHLIRENGLPSTYKTEKVMFPDNKFLLREMSGESKIPSRNIALTDEFSTPATTQDGQSPLYYRAKTKGYFDAKGAPVYPYKGGYMAQPPEKVYDYAEIIVEDRDQLLYMGNKIRITYLDGSPLKTEYKYKVQLIREEGEGIPPNSYSVYVYTSFRSSKDETFVIRYEKYNNNGSHTDDYVEVLNAHPFFEQVNKKEIDDLVENPKVNGEWREELTHKKYALVESKDRENTYEVYAPSQVVVANHITRPPHQFKYKIESRLRTKLNATNPGKIKVGIAYLNQTYYAQEIENLSGVLKKLNEDVLRPQYLDFENPHNSLLSLIKENIKYWAIDLNMPPEHYNDYDLIILTGYGFYDMRPHNDSLRSFMRNGGTLWVDNGGSGDGVLSFTTTGGEETFLTNVGFSKTTNETGFKVKGKAPNADDFLNRLYVIGSTQLGIGHTGVNPRITFGSGELATRWSTIVEYGSTKPSVMYRPFEEKGLLMVSNCGIFRSIFYSNEVNTKLAMNIMLALAEEKWLTTPWMSDYVYHRDNLFRQEYKGFGDDVYYVDDRNDKDETQIVAKKIVNKTVRDQMLPYIPKAFYSGRGDYRILVNSNNEVTMDNTNFEVGAYDKTTGAAITQWNQTTVEAIKGWSTKYMAGSTAQFKHITNYSHRGEKAIQVSAPDDGIGSHAYWLSKTPTLPGGSYKITVWLKTTDGKGAGGTGPAVGVYDLDGTKVGVSTAILGTRDWTRVELNFSVKEFKQVEIRTGFVDGNGSGTVMIDYFSLESIGSVYQTPDGNGQDPLYFYAVRPKGTSFDIKEQGFDSSDITLYDPEITLTFVVRAFVFVWNSTIGKMERKTGNYVIYNKKMRRSDGIVNLGSISTLLPALNEGFQWADTNKIYYEIFIGNNNGVDLESQFVNMYIYDKESGEYHFNKDGEFIIRHMDIYYGRTKPKDIIIQARTDYYTIRGTKRRYGMKVESEDKIELAYPSTVDTRDCWFLRVKNGAFVKKEMSYQDLLELKMHDNRYYEFQERLFGTHYYSLPEYGRQVFKPSIGIKRVEKEIAEYVNDNTIRVQDAPLYVKEGEVKGEIMTAIDDKKKIFRALNGDWLKEAAIKVEVDEDNDGGFVLWTDYYDADYKNGYIIFDRTVNGKVRVSYSYKNLRIFKRKYNNSRIRNEFIQSEGERLSTSDYKTFVSKHRNWMAFPTPVVRLVTRSGEKGGNIAPPTMYKIDYEAGTLTFKDDMKSRVLVDYSYSTDEELNIRDYDIQNGLIYLESNIDFKDELYVNYYYEEQYVEYRGYWDDFANRFIRLDLNPMDGHYCTLPTTERINNLDYTIYKEVPTAKLMNKEVYVYIVPHKDSFGNHTEHTIRHCFSNAEWKSIQKTNPAALLLGTVYIREHAQVTDAVVLDARKRGGGIREDISDATIRDKSYASLSNWDIGAWDGKAYYRNGVLIIEIPKKILQSEGGQFAEKEVTDIVKKYIAYGIYYIVEFI